MRAPVRVTITGSWPSIPPALGMPIKRIRGLSILPKAGAQPKRRSAWEAIKKGSSAGSTAFAQKQDNIAAPLSTVGAAD